MFRRQQRFEKWVQAARRILKSGGALTLIWRADGLVEVLSTLGRGFGSLELYLSMLRPRVPAIRVLIRAIKGGKAPPSNARRAAAQ